MIQTLKESGFCQGVQSAINKANSRVIDMPKGVYLFGDLVNNKHVMRDYTEKGFIVTEDINEIKNNSIVIIRAHGVAKNIYDELNKKNIIIEDGTCPIVKSIHNIVEEQSNKGFQIIIIGKKQHPEVRGILGWCKKAVAERRGLGQNPIVIENEADLNLINWDIPICVVAQTTCNKEWWEKSTKLILSKCENAEIYNTLCNVTAKRIKKAKTLAKDSDIMIVVGDEKSANSIELYEVCKAICKNTYFVQSVGELQNIELNKNRKIGIVGSASTPLSVMEELQDCLTFMDFLTSAKKEIDDYSDVYFNEKITSIRKPFIKDAIEDLYTQHKGGKRIRGAMVKLGERIAKNEQKNRDCKDFYLPITLAYEIFQTAILIHDDIIDSSTTRRGKETIHTTAAKEINPHYGLSKAICVGDYGLFMANSILAENLPASILAKILKLFADIQLTTLEGEIMDVTLPYKPMDIISEYEKYMETINIIFTNKTAWYTLAGPIMLGAICGNASDELITQLRDITLLLGVAFQSKDDLLGIYANEEVLGKSALSDIIEKKQTLLYGYAYKNACDDQRKLLETSYGNIHATRKDLEIVREIFTTTGSKEYAENEIHNLSQQAMDIIKNSAIIDEDKNLLRGLVHYLITRKY